MSIFNFWRKPTTENKEGKVDLSKLENHFIIHTEAAHCDTCKDETNHCYKMFIGDGCMCVCPRKDLKGFKKPKK